MYIMGEFGFFGKKGIDFIIFEKGRDFVYCRVNSGNCLFFFIVVYGCNDLLYREDL